MNIFIYKDGKQFGPYSVEQTRYYIKEKVLNYDDYACIDGQNWTKLEDITEFLVEEPNSESPSESIHETKSQPIENLDQYGKNKVDKLSNIEKKTTQYSKLKKVFIYSSTAFILVLSLFLIIKNFAISDQKDSSTNVIKSKDAVSKNNDEDQKKSNGLPKEEKEEVVERWKFHYFVDEFGDDMESGFITTEVIDGKFSNSATQDSPLNVMFLVGPNYFAIMLFEYAGSNPVKAYTDHYYQILVKLGDRKLSFDGIMPKTYKRVMMLDTNFQKLKNELSLYSNLSRQEKNPLVAKFVIKENDSNTVYSFNLQIDKQLFELYDSKFVRTGE